MQLDRLNQKQFDQFRAFIYEKCGIRIDEKKVALLSNRIRSRLKAGNFESFDVYYRFLTSGAGSDELEGFLDAITTNETAFFRSSKHFDWLKTELLDELVAVVGPSEGIYGMLDRLHKVSPFLYRKIDDT